jgi:hypothetical protein
MSAKPSEGFSSPSDLVVPTRQEALAGVGSCRKRSGGLMSSASGTLFCRLLTRLV